MSETIKLTHPDATSCSWNGETFEANPADGTFEVPVEAAADLIPHGFAAAAALPPAPERKANPAQMTTDALLAEALELKIPDAADMDRMALVQAVAAARKAKE